MIPRSFVELEAGLDEIRRSPAEYGRLRLIVRRPIVEQREILETAQLDTERGLVGEVSVTPHTGCAKFSGRFGIDTLPFVSTPEGRELRLRGMNTRVLQGGTIRVGDRMGKA